MVLDQQHAGALRGDRRDQRAQPLDLVGGQPGGGLVQQQEAPGRSISARAISMKRSSLCCSRSARTAASASSPTARSASMRPRAQRAPRRAGAAAGPAAASTKLARPVDGAADHDVLQHRGLADQARRLERAGDARRGARLRRRPRGSACAAERDRARLAARRSRRSTFSVVVLPLPFGPISPCTSPGCRSQVEPVDRAHRRRSSARRRAARSAPRPRRGRSSAGSSSGRGTMARSVSSGRRLPKSSSSAMPPGHQQHDHQQQRGVEEGGPGDQRRRELRQHGQQDASPSSGPEDRAAAADQDGDEEQHRQVEGEGVRRDVGSAAWRTARPRPPAGGAAEQEHRSAAAAPWRCRWPRPRPRRRGSRPARGRTGCAAMLASSRCTSAASATQSR